MAAPTLSANRTLSVRLWLAIRRGYRWLLGHHRPRFELPCYYVE